MTTFYAKLDTMKMNFPLGYSPLQQLYPGRLMPVTEVYDRYSFPSLEPNLAVESFDRNKEDTQAYGAHIEAVARAASPTSGKMTYHQVDDPSSFSEDPNLGNLQLMQPPAFDDALEDKERYDDSSEDPKKLNGSRKKENFGIVGSKQDRIWICVFGLLSLLIVVKINS